MQTVPVSGTIGQGRVVGKLIMRLTHSIRMNWLLPGIPPSGKRVEVPILIDDSGRWLKQGPPMRPRGVTAASTFGGRRTQSWQGYQTGARLFVLSICKPSLLNRWTLPVGFAGTALNRK
jgi:hypothetical protein